MGAPGLKSFVASLPDRGTFSLWAGPVAGPPVLAHRAEAQHYAASTMKIWVVLAAYRGADAQTLDLNSTVTLHNTFFSAATGRPFSVDRADDGDPEPFRREGSAVVLRWLAHRALVRSSNLATNLLLEAVGLPSVVEAIRAAGATDSVVTRGIEDTDAREAGLSNVVTASDLATTLQSLAAGTAASAASCREILAVLAAQQFNDGLPAGLPPGTRVAHKTGEVEGVAHDAGIVYPEDAAPYVVVVCTTSHLSETEGNRLIAAAARASWTDRRVAG